MYCTRFFKFCIALILHLGLQEVIKGQQTADVKGPRKERLQKIVYAMFHQRVTCTYITEAAFSN